MRLSRISYRCSVMLKLTSVFVISALSLAAHGADLLSGSAAPLPSMTASYAVPNTWCPGPTATSFTTTGLPMACQNYVWKLIGIADVQAVSQYTYIDGLPLPRLVETFVQCPAGKTIVSGGCNFNGFSTDVMMDESGPNLTGTGWNCSFVVNSITERNPLTGLQANAICAIYGG